MPLYAVGLNHRTAPIDVRECLAFPVNALHGAVDALRRETRADEALLVSTCNRTELYLRAMQGEVVDRAMSWLAGLPSVRGKNLAPHLYRFTDAAVPRHAFRVASGLDSMVLGEPQILGQIKLATKIAIDAHTLAGPLNRLFQETLSVAKEVRTETALGKTSVSMAAVAAKLAQQVFGEMHGIRLLLVGAGEMIELTATHFAALKPREIVIANRTLERGSALADRFHARAISLHELRGCLHQFDVVITSTASTLPIIGKGMVERAMKLRRRRPMFIVDLAVPRDVEPEVTQVDDVFLHTLDSLGGIVGENRDARAAAIAEAQRIIERRATDFMQWLDARSAVPVIQRLRRKTDADSARELVRGRKMLAAGIDPMAALEAVARGITNKYLHQPLGALNRCPAEERERLTAAVEALFVGPV